VKVVTIEQMARKEMWFKAWLQTKLLMGHYRVRARSLRS
jgi:hypothetical protein